MTPITSSRLATLHADLAAQRAASWTASNPPSQGPSPTAFAAAQTYAATTMTWANIVAFADKTEPEMLALVGTDLDGSGFVAATLSDVRSFRSGVRAVRDAVTHTGKGSNPSTRHAL